MSAARIMVVEDEQIVGHDIKQRLERMGYEVVGPVASGDDVIPEIERTHPQLLLMDVFLNSRIDGIQAADMVRERFALPVVYLTAYSNEETLDRAKRTAPLGFIHKPVADHELRAAVEMALYKHSLETRLRHSEALLSVTLRNLGEAVLTTDAAGRIEYLNITAAQLTGWTCEEACGRDIAEVLTIADERTLAPLDLHTDGAAGRLAAARSISNCMLLGRSKRRVPVEVSLSALRDGATGLNGLVVLIRDVSDRERARREIESLQKQLEFVLGETATNIDIIDSQYNLRYVDPAWRRLYGEIEGRKCYEYFMGLDKPCPTCGIARAFETKTINVVEQVLERENHRPVQVTTVPYQNEDGEWLVAELNVDLTERKRAESQVAIQRDLAMALASAVTPAAAMELFLDAALRIAGMDCGGVYLNAEDGKLLRLVVTRGLSDEFKRAAACVDASHPVWPILEKGAPVYTTYDAMRAEMPKPLHQEALRALAILPIMHHGRLIGCCNLAARDQAEVAAYARAPLGLMLDQVGNVIARIMAEQAVRDSETHHRHLFDNAPVGYHEIDMQGRLCRVNRTELNMLGYAAEEMLGRPVWDFVLDPDSQASVLKKLSSGSVPEGSYERTYVRRDGAHVPVLVKEYALHDEHGRIQGIRSAIQDITEQRNAQEERMRFAERMNEVQKLESIGLLAGGIAHDFNNLLMGIQGNAELALMKLPAQSSLHASLQDIKTACQRAAELTGQLLAYAGKGKYVVEPLNLSAMVREMIQLLHTLIGPLAELKLELDDRLPVVEGDGVQLRQVVMNLITNAVEALPDRRGTISLTTRVMEIGAGHEPSHYCRNSRLKPGRYCQLVVSDTGCGIDEAGLQHLFEPFFTTKFMGRGLGLAAVLGIVRNHGGDIHVVSQPGAGSTFTVLLPARDNVAAPAPPTVAAPAAGADGHGMLLLVDDDKSILRVVSRFLEERGFRVVQVADGTEAVALFNRHAAQLRAVILDLTLPGMSGEEVFRIMQHACPEVPILVCSGHSESEAASRFAANTNLAFIQKPYELRKLHERLNAVMRHVPA